jgi:hypothetical protein
LNRNHNPQLKQIFKGAALQALRHELFKDYYQGLVDGGTRPELARVSVRVSWRASHWQSGNAERNSTPRKHLLKTES